MEKERRYQSCSFSFTIFMTPDREDSTGNGTRIWVENEAGRCASWGAMAKSQRPLRLRQSVRTSCGRGYSGCAFLGETSAAQRVLSGPVAGRQDSAANAVVVTRAAMSRLVRGFIIKHRSSIRGCRRK